MRLVLFVIFLTGLPLTSIILAQEQERKESEFKLAVPEIEVERLGEFLLTTFNGSYCVVGADTLSVDRSEELFTDVYFDTREKELLNQQIGLRYRKRYIENELLSELIQLKLPHSTDGVLRQEIKFDVVSKIDFLDERASHPLLQCINLVDRDRLSFYLRKYEVNVKDLRKALSLKQLRQRTYFADKKGSVATITLDEVNDKTLPYQGFTELEIEINEIRYTSANLEERQYLEGIVEQLKHKIISTFPALRIDQTPKYNKLAGMLDENVYSKLSNYGMWLVYCFVVGLAVIKFVYEA